MGANGTSGAAPGHEYRPAFHEWATALPGMICLSRKARNATFRNYVAAETATPVVSCAACMKQADEKQFYFAGICRSKSIRPIDDGIGPSTDEYFTLSIGGMSTLLNNSSAAIFPGDTLEWCFYSEHDHAGATVAPKRQKQGPRRFGVRVSDALSERIIGRSLSFAKPGEYSAQLITDAFTRVHSKRYYSIGETFDLLLRGC